MKKEVIFRLGFEILIQGWRTAVGCISKEGGGFSAFEEFVFQDGVIGSIEE